MPRVKGFLRIIKRGRPGHPDIGLPDEGDGLVDPDYGIDEGELPEVEPPEPPPGIWPPLTPQDPWRPVDPGWGLRPGLPPTVGGGPARPPGVPPTVGGGPARPERPVDPGYGVDEGAGVGGGPVFPPGAIWPPLPPDVHGKFLALVLVAGMPGVKYRYVVIDADAIIPPKPSHPIPPRPDQGLPPGVPEREPKR